MMEEIIFSPLWCLIQKLDHNSRLHAKNQREISKNEVRSPPPPFVWKCGHSPFNYFALRFQSKSRFITEKMSFILTPLILTPPFISVYLQTIKTIIV